MKSNQAQVAAIIRKELKRKGIKSRVTSRAYAGGDSVTVQLFDPTPNQIENVKYYCKNFQYGSFDGMEDVYEYTNKQDDIPQTKFLFVEVEYSPQFEEASCA